MNKDKIDFKFLMAWEDQSNTDFTFFGKVKTPLTTEQENQLKSFGIKNIMGPIFTAHNINREAVEDISKLDFVISLSLSTKLRPIKIQ